MNWKDDLREEKCRKIYNTIETTITNYCYYHYYELQPDLSLYSLLFSMSMVFSSTIPSIAALYYNSLQYNKIR